MGKKECGKQVFNSKRSQITIFVIFALVIIAVLIILLYPTFRNAIVPLKPVDSIPRACIENAVREALNVTMMRGGIAKPELYFRYNNETLAYLCYTNQWYTTCTMQEPMLKQKIEAEVEAYAKANITKCISQMEDKLKSRGYTIKASGSRNADINLVPDKARVNFNLSMSLQKGEEKMTISSSMFQTEFRTNVYEIIMTAASILNYEARFGDSSADIYTAYYPNLKVEKKKQDDGTKVYIITDRDTQEKLQFATRSLAWPPGFALFQ